MEPEGCEISRFCIGFKLLCSVIIVNLFFLRLPLHPINFYNLSTGVLCVIKSLLHTLQSKKAFIKRAMFHTFCKENKRFWAVVQNQLHLEMKLADKMARESDRQTFHGSKLCIILQRLLGNILDKRGFCLVGGLFSY